MTKVLVIDKNTKLDKITNKEQYSKIIIRDKVNPKKLTGFDNINELVISYPSNIKGFNYNELNLDKLPFIWSVEKLAFEHCNSFGIIQKGNKSANYCFENNHFKIIEFPKNLNIIYDEYLLHSHILETIIFNVDGDTLLSSNLKIPNSVKQIIIKCGRLEFPLDLEYEIKSIDEICYNALNEKIIIKYKGIDIKSEILIDLNNYKIYEKHIWSNYDNSISKLYIPDYVTELYYIERRDYQEISFNLKLLESTNQIFNFTVSENYKQLEKIILRSNNDMKLIPKQVIKPKDYGELEKFYIENHLLKLIYKNFELVIDSNGNIEKIDKVVNEEEKEIIDLNKYTATELDEYMCYKKLLENLKDNDIDYKKALEVVEDRVIKRLLKRR